MGKLLASLSLLVIAAACTEDIAAPGACPEFCPSSRIKVIDTIIAGLIERDSSFRGFVSPQDAASMQVISGGPITARGVIRFGPFEDSATLVNFGSDQPVLATDSFRLKLNLARRFPVGSNIDLAIHRLPANIDSTKTFGDLDQFFADSTLIATIDIADSVTSDSLLAILAADAFPTLVADSLVAAIGIAIRSVGPALVDVFANGSGNGASLLRWVQIDSSDGTRVQRSGSRQVDFDSFVFSASGVSGPDVLSVGGSPSARALLRVNAPSFIVDTSNVIRATLIMIPSEPVMGLPGDTIRIQAEGLVTDFGPKSPIIPLPSDSLLFGSALLPVGSMDTVRIDITHIVVPWKNAPAVPRSFMLRVVPEGAGVGEYRFQSSRASFGSPLIQWTFIPPVGTDR